VCGQFWARKAHPAQRVEDKPAGFVGTYIDMIANHFTDLAPDPYDWIHRRERVLDDH
jgi:hypothetical protein